MNSKRLTGLADPVNPQDAMTKAAADGAASGYVKRTGDTMTSALIWSATAGGATTSDTSFYINQDGASLVLHGGVGSSIYGINFQNGASTVSWGSIGPGGLQVAGTINCVGDLSCNAINSSGISAAGRKSRSGINGAFGGSWHNWFWSGTVQAWVDTTNLGNVTLTSDYRIKKDVIDLPGMWDQVKALRPIQYTHANFNPPSHDAKDGGYMFTADDTPCWGFIAHELQDTLLPSAATGEKDGEHPQSPNVFPIVAALTKALQEAMARIEALEAGGT